MFKIVYSGPVPKHGGVYNENTDNTHVFTPVSNPLSHDDYAAMGVDPALFGDVVGIHETNDADFAAQCSKNPGFVVIV